MGTTLWVFRRGDGVADRARGVHAGLHDLAPVRGVIAAVHAASGEVDDHVRAVDLRPPVAARRRIPRERFPRSRPRTPAEHDDLVTLAVKGAGEDGADLAGAAGDDDLHRALQ